MKTFYCIIKYRKDGFWFDLIKDNIQAENKTEAREKIKEEFEINIPMRLKLKDVNEGDLLLKLYEHNNKYFSVDFFKEKECRLCHKKFTMTEKYNVYGKYVGEEYCSPKCESIEYDKGETYSEYFMQSNPVIYKITKISTGKCYIGQTKRSFTWRWWEHIKTKDWIDDIKDFTFQVIENLSENTGVQIILERETYWIKHYDSINNGFNQVASKKINTV